jgi:hypothetical protein
MPVNGMAVECETVLSQVQFKDGSPNHPGRPGSDCLTSSGRLLEVTTIKEAMSL